MPLSRSKYKRLPDLYVAGTEVVLIDGTPLWMQVLNPFEIDEARHDAQIARSRLVMALGQHGSQEMQLVEAALWQDGAEGACQRLVDLKASERLMKAVESIENDPEWTERLDIIKRSDEENTRYEEVEKELLAKLQLDYINEVNARTETEAAFAMETWSHASNEAVLAEYTKLYVERRGSDLAMQEYRVVEIWYGARVCEGVQMDDGTWDHSACEGHKVQVFESKADVRELAQPLADLLGAAIDAVAMSQRDAKDLDRPASSSDSSRRPSPQEESTLSIPTETPVAAPGTSTSPSLTPSPS